ncbi:MAG: CDP-diacylglycerol--serine O-phosphatidyltransferase, partial [Synergistaceae bacterium]|nr:CDP-diacylglycerol--serine O-phosphatidyltransferase [Synergistaceae bacterium]
IMALILLAVGGLMISSIPYANMKKLTKKTADPIKCSLLFAMFALSFIFLKNSAPLFLFSLYIISGLIRFDWGSWILKHENEEAEAEKVN